MAYTPPPTFVDDNVLSASQLNILADDIEYLHGLAGQVNVPTPQLLLKDNAEHKWAVRHKHRYLVVELRYYIDTVHNAQVVFDLDYGSNTSADNVTYTSPTNAWTDVTRTIDLDALSSAPSVGTWYEIVLQATWDGSGAAGNSAMHLVRMYERE